MTDMAQLTITDGLGGAGNDEANHTPNTWRQRFQERFAPP
jgi:hypothetical protein